MNAPLIQRVGILNLFYLQSNMNYEYNKKYSSEDFVYLFHFINSSWALFGSVKVVLSFSNPFHV